MNKQNEIALIEAIRKRDPEAEKELFRVFTPRILSKVHYTLGTHNQDCRDLVSDIQISMLMSLRKGRFNTDKGISLGSYVYGITRNKLKDYFHDRKKKNVSADPSVLDCSGIEDDHEFERDELHQMLRQLLKKLKFKYQEVLYLRYYEEYSVREISEQLNLPPRRVSERLHYALKLLRKKCPKKYFQYL